MGLTEANPHLISPTGDPAFAPWRDHLARLRPRFVRVLVTWAALQPRPDAPPDFAVPADGCARGSAPCAPSRGLRDLLTAIRDRQEADGGWAVSLVPLGTPAWSARPAVGCERPGTGPSARMPGIAAYRAFVRSVQGLAREVGVKIAYWSAWNEPNHPATLNPQRLACDRDAAPAAPSRYARLARALAGELRPGQRMILGELAGYGRPRLRAAGVREFLRALPRDVACAPGPLALHAYVGRRGPRAQAPVIADPATAGDREVVDAADAALRRRGCPKAIWITETGTFDHRCEAMAAALRAWARDPRVDAAFQYTFREDSHFPLGLADPGLTTTYPSYRAWQTAATPGGPPPEACSDGAHG